LKLSCDFVVKKSSRPDFFSKIIFRVVTPECKRELADTACKSETGRLYPSSLPNLCPALASDAAKSSGTYLGCFRDEFQHRILQGSFARLADNSR
jgi:hypothetical protein